MRLTKKTLALVAGASFAWAASAQAEASDAGRVPAEVETGSVPAEPDNSGRNVRDRDDRTLDVHTEDAARRDLAKEIFEEAARRSRTELPAAAWCGRGRARRAAAGRSPAPARSLSALAALAVEPSARVLADREVFDDVVGARLERSRRLDEHETLVAPLRRVRDER